MDLDRVLQETNDVTDLPKLVATLGHRPLWDEIPAEVWPEHGSGRRRRYDAPRPTFIAGLMDPDARRSSGTFYTPAALVERVLDAGLAALIAERLRCSVGEAERRLR